MHEVALLGSSVADAPQWPGRLMRCRLSRPSSSRVSLEARLRGMRNTRHPEWFEQDMQCGCRRPLRTRFALARARLCTSQGFLESGPRPGGALGQTSARTRGTLLLCSTCADLSSNGAPSGRRPAGATTAEFDARQHPTEPGRGGARRLAQRRRRPMLGRLASRRSVASDGHVLGGTHGRRSTARGRRERRPHPARACGALESNAAEHCVRCPCLAQDV